MIPVYNEIKGYITQNKAFGTAARTIDDYKFNCSTGVRMLLDRLPEAERGIMESIDNFLHCEFGDFYEWGEVPPKEYAHRDAYGRYEIDGFDEYIYIHYEPTFSAELVVYLDFER